MMKLLDKWQGSSDSDKWHCNNWRQWGGLFNELFNKTSKWKACNNGIYIIHYSKITFASRSTIDKDDNGDDDDGDDDDDDDDNELFLRNGWLKKGAYVLFPAGTIVWDSPSQISDTPQPRFEPAQNLSSDIVEWSCAVVIATTPQCHKFI